MIYENIKQVSNILYRLSCIKFVCVKKDFQIFSFHRGQCRNSLAAVAIC